MVISIICLYSVLQSIFGVGVLLFGTPTLLLLGYSFQDTLLILLPASLTVSLLQITLDRDGGNPSLNKITFWSLPGLIFGLWICFGIKLKIKIDFLIAIMLILSAGVRFIWGASSPIGKFLSRNSRLSFIAIGSVHGLTNMGGSLLSDYAATSQNDKLIARQMVATGYAIFTLTQLSILSYYVGIDRVLSNFKYGIFSGMVYLILGRRLFAKINGKRYEYSLISFMVGCAMMLVMKSILTYS